MRGENYEDYVSETLYVNKQNTNYLVIRKDSKRFVLGSVKSMTAAGKL
jgi:hypothetical protein